MQLYIGNKNYSSWSMRPWVLMRQAGIDFEEVLVRFDSFEPGSKFKAAMKSVSPAGKVPVLVDGDVVVWDTLAIAEYLAERFPALQLWPTRAADRARARSICAEMHSGFGALRSQCSMNIEAQLPEVGQRVMQETDVVTDLQRLSAMWTDLLDQHGGPMLFGSFTIADAFFAPVAMRVNTYALPLAPQAARYVQRLSELSAVQQWVAQALMEKDFRDFEEPYRAAGSQT
jgi:glutathione S-transferase